ncbi:Leucine-rich repeat receptor-like serine/threonine-protein kinase [Quillaja saponaria]|uniref:Leucine-rich repeat receptor-like serine/threonine-protein kinase n=1 Tax=Quillaja saponaria TaxID=32244 RepID=A0AAD7PGN2_QUISA|nr:Leucine-rich repeat receptor-like serine/threonine-protein kinase [Quillaja saponaria]
MDSGFRVCFWFLAEQGTSFGLRISMVGSTALNIRRCRRIMRIRCIPIMKSFGYPGPIIRYPDDQFAGSGSLLAKVIPPKQAAAMFLFLVFWNLPPLKVFQTQLTTNKSEPLVLRCPAASFSNSTYYIALYFAHNLESPGAGSRVFNMCKWSSLCPQFVSDFSRCSYLCHPVTTCWSYNITLTPAANSSSGPLINAGEDFDVLTLGKNNSRW